MIKQLLIQFYNEFLKVYSDDEFESFNKPIMGTVHTEDSFEMQDEQLKDRTDLLYIEEEDGSSILVNKTQAENLLKLIKRKV